MKIHEVQGSIGILSGRYFCLEQVWVQLRLDLFQFRPVTVSRDYFVLENMVF